MFANLNHEAASIAWSRVTDYRSKNRGSCAHRYSRACHPYKQQDYITPVMHTLFGAQSIYCIQNRIQNSKYVFTPRGDCFDEGPRSGPNLHFARKDLTNQK